MNAGFFLVKDPCNTQRCEETEREILSSACYGQRLGELQRQIRGIHNYELFMASRMSSSTLAHTPGSCSIWL